MSFSETILLPMRGDVPDNVKFYKRVQNIPDNTKIKVYSGLTPNGLSSILLVKDFYNYGNYFWCSLANGLTVDTNHNIIAEVYPLDGKVETNSKVPQGTVEINSKAPEINSKIDAAENELIQAIRDAIASFKEKITQTRRGGRRKRRRTRNNKRL
jgi:hypothetical protein